MINYGQMKNPKKNPFGWRADTTKTVINQKNFSKFASGLGWAFILSKLSVVLSRGSFQVLNYPKLILQKIRYKEKQLNTES